MKKQLKLKIKKSFLVLMSSILLFLSIVQSATIPVHAEAFTLTYLAQVLQVTLASSFGLNTTSSEANTYLAEMIQTGVTSSFDFGVQYITDYFSLDASNSQAVSDFNTKYAPKLALSSGDTPYSYLYNCLITLDRLTYCTTRTAGSTNVLKAATSLSNTTANTSVNNYVKEEIAKVQGGSLDSLSDKDKLDATSAIAEAILIRSILAKALGDTTFKPTYPALNVRTAVTPTGEYVSAMTDTTYSKSHFIPSSVKNSNGSYTYSILSKQASDNYIMLNKTFNSPYSLALVPDSSVHAYGHYKLCSSVSTSLGNEFTNYLGVPAYASGGHYFVYPNSEQYPLVTNLPIFSSETDCRNFLITGVPTNCLNLGKNVADVKATTPTIASTIPSTKVLQNTKIKTSDISAISSAIDALPDAIPDQDDATAKLKTIFDTSDSTVTARPDATTDPTTDPTTEEPTIPSTDGSILGIIQAILAAIIGIPKLIYGFFKTILDSILLAVKALPVAVNTLLAVPLQKIEDAIGFLSPDLTDISDAVTTFPTTLAKLFEDILDVDFPALLKDIKDSIITIPVTLVALLLDPLGKIKDAVDKTTESVKAISIPISIKLPSEDDISDKSNTILDIFNILLLLALILIVLLRIFISSLVFIVNIFNIPSDPGFLNPTMISAIDFLKTFQIQGMHISIYNFLLSLVYITLIFAVIKVLRREINNIKIK